MNAVQGNNSNKLNGVKHQNAVERLTLSIGSVSSLVLHTILFLGAFGLSIAGLVSWSFMLLVLTTILSLEAIYLAIFIQMTVNRHSQELEEVSEDVEDIQEDIMGISEDVDDIQENIITADDVIIENTTSASVTLESLTADVHRLLKDLESLKHKN